MTTLFHLNPNLILNHNLPPVLPRTFENGIKIKKKIKISSGKGGVVK